jgi:hypothetical protein
MIMYSNDYDDMYAREDGCTLNDSEVAKFNGLPTGTDPTPYCNGNGPANDGVGGYAFRDNAYNWSKWVMPYIKNTQLIYHPVIVPNTTDGEVDGGYALNSAITGQMNTWSYLPTSAHHFKYQYRQSWLGGQTTAVPDPAEAWLIMEQITYSVVGAYDYNSNASGTSETVYPLAVKEHWEGYFYQNTTNHTDPLHECYAASTAYDLQAAPFSESIPMSFCDGHTKAVQAGAFLAQTPTAAQYLGYGYSTYICGLTDSYYSSGAPNTNLNYPFWGLTGS